MYQARLRNAGSRAGRSTSRRHSPRPAKSPMKAAAVAMRPISHLVPVATVKGAAMVVGKTGANHLLM